MTRGFAISMVFSAIVFGALVVGTLHSFANDRENVFTYASILWIPFHAIVLYKMIPEDES